MEHQEVSTCIPPEWNQRAIESRHRRDAEPGDGVDQSGRTAGGSLPEDPHEQRRIRNRLIVLAAAMPVAQLLRWLFR